MPLVHTCLLNPYKFLGGNSPKRWGFVKLHFGYFWAFRVMLGHSFLELGTGSSGFYKPIKGEYKDD